MQTFSLRSFKKGPCIPLVFLAIGLVMAMHPALFSGLGLMQTDLGDTRFNHYLLEHSFVWAKGGLGSRGFWNAPFFHPHPNVMAYSDVLLGVAPIYWLWRAFFSQPEIAYQFWMMCLFALNFIVFFVFYRHWLARDPRDLWAPSLGAFLFAFAGPRVSQIVHQQMIAQFYAVIAFYALAASAHHAAGSFGKARIWIAIFFLSATAQFYAGFYHTWFLVFTLCVGFVVSLLLRPMRESLLRLMRTQWLWIALSAAVAFAASLPLVLAYRKSVAEVGFRSFEETRWVIPVIQSWFHHGQDSWIYPWLRRVKLFGTISIEYEQRLGLGFLTSALVVLGFAWKRKAPRFALIGFTTLAVMVASSKLPGELTLWKFVYEFFPGANAIRVVSRIGLFLLFGAAVGFAAFFEEARARGRAVATIALLAGFAVLEQGKTTPAFDWRERWDHLALLAEQLPSGCGAFLLFDPDPASKTENWKIHMDAMWLQMLTGVPTINGYSGSAPPGWPFTEPRIGVKLTAARLDENVEIWAKAKGLDPRSICKLAMKQ